MNHHYSFGAKLLAILALVTAQTSHAYFPANESTYLNFPIPSHLRRNESWPHVASNFGNLGHGPEGSIVLPVRMFTATNHSHHLCNDNYDYEFLKSELKIPADSGAPFILLIERGECTFVRKVRNAQHLGASGVLIADASHDHLPANVDLLHLDHGNHSTAFRLGDDGSGKDISIPSMLIAKREYEAIKHVIEQHNSSGTVVAEMAWHVPKFENKVVMELWHSPVNTHTKEFLASNFSVLASKFDLNEHETYKEDMNLMIFEEHPVLLDGEALGCKGNTESPDEACYGLCTNGGRYCHASHHHTDGKDIVTESLRRICIRKHYTNPKTYWSYLDYFLQNCFDHDFFANDKCIESAYHHASIQKELIESCFSDSGHPNEDHENSFLQHSLELQFQWGIYQSPSVFINHEPSMIVGFEGLTPRNVLYSLCETFAYGEKPHVCYACMHCGDPVACAKRSPMKCLASDGVEKEDPNAHKNTGGNGGSKHHGHHRGHRARKWIFGIFLVGGFAGAAFVYYKKHFDGIEGSGLGHYSLQDAFLSDNP